MTRSLDESFSLLQRILNIDAKVLRWLTFDARNGRGLASLQSELAWVRGQSSAGLSAQNETAWVGLSGNDKREGEVGYSVWAKSVARIQVGDALKARASCLWNAVRAVEEYFGPMSNKLIWAAWALQPGEDICMDGYNGSDCLRKRIKKDQDGFSLIMKLFLRSKTGLMMLPSAIKSSEWTYQLDNLHTRYLSVITPRSMLQESVMIPAFNPNRGVSEVCKMDGELVDKVIEEISQDWGIPIPKMLTSMSFAPPTILKSVRSAVSDLDLPDGYYLLSELCSRIQQRSTRANLLPGILYKSIFEYVELGRRGVGDVKLISRLKEVISLFWLVKVFCKPSGEDGTLSDVPIEFLRLHLPGRNYDSMHWPFKAFDRQGEKRIIKRKSPEERVNRLLLPTGAAEPDGGPESDDDDYVSPLHSRFDPETLGVPPYESLLPIGGKLPSLARIKRNQSNYDRMVKEYKQKLAEYKKREYGKRRAEELDAEYKAEEAKAEEAKAEKEGGDLKRLKRS